jgi:hypothetical protein
VDESVLTKAGQALNDAWAEETGGAAVPLGNAWNAETRGLEKPAFNFLEFVLPIVAGLLQSCLGGLVPQTPKQVAQAAQGGRLLARLRVRAAVSAAMARDFGPGSFRTHGGQEVVNAILRAGQKLTAEDAAALAAL